MSNSVAIIINSCYKFHKSTIEHIINSAKIAQIPSQNIYIVVGESDEETDIIKENDYNIVYCKFVNIDYNGIIYFTQTERGLNELKKYTHFFYMHDTCLFKDFFWDKIVNYSKDCNEYIKLENIWTKNIGLFNVNWFIENKKDLFKHFINYDKELALTYKKGDFPNKDFIYYSFNCLLPEFLCEDSVFSFERNNENGYIDPIGTTFKNDDKPRYFVSMYNQDQRLATEYNEPGIIKYQKNWGNVNPSPLDL